MIITGKDLIDLGYKPGRWFANAIEAVNAANIDSLGRAIEIIDFHKPAELIPLRTMPAPYFMNIVAENEHEADNIAKVQAHMGELMRVPTVVAGAVMPDACPSDKRLGYIPVGGVVATRNAIHPGMHSADICCSMAVTVFEDADPTALLDAGMVHSHFGGGGRPRGEQWQPPREIMLQFERNKFLDPLTSLGIEHFGTQGDGNHFFYVGRLASTGQVALVTHHGSRGPGAKLYKKGMTVANRTRLQLSPETPDYNAWIVADSKEGEEYWGALQTIRKWTKASHFAIHDRVAEAVGVKRVDRFWNEHNFVFQRSDGLFYHAKGATPSFYGYAADASGLTLIPLNMAEPILIARPTNSHHGLGFAPHGAGRNFSRTAHLRSHGERPAAEILAEETAGIDARFFSGIPDLSELPSAYKNAASVRRQIELFGLAEIVDTIEPIGSIMAGDWQRDAPWRQKRNG